MNRNHAHQALNDRIHFGFFFRCCYNPRSCFSPNFDCRCLCSSCTSFLYGKFSTGCVYFVWLFSRFSSSFFPPHSASQLILFQKIVFYLLVTFNNFSKFFHLFIYLLPQINGNLIINYKRAILLATFMLGLRQTKGSIFISSLLNLIPKL